MISKDGKFQYLEAYHKQSEQERAAGGPIHGKMCICHHFSKYNCYTCGHNVFRLKATVEKLPNGDYEVPRAATVLEDYLCSEWPSAALEERAEYLLASA